MTMPIYLMALFEVECMPFGHINAIDYSHDPIYGDDYKHILE